MHLSSLPAQRGHTKCRASICLTFTLLCLAIVTTILEQGAVGQLFQVRPRRTPAGGQEVSAGVYLPTDRSLSRAISRAKERLDEHEYHEVLAFLQGILARDEDA